MHVESNALRQSFVPQPMLRSSWPQLVMFGLGVDSWRERAISEVRGLRDERGPTQLGIYTRQSRDPRVKPEDDNYLLVIPRLDRGICKGDVRLKAEYDKEKMRPNMTRATPRMTILHLLFPRVSRFLLSLNRSRAGLHRSRLTALPELLPTLRQV